MYLLVLDLILLILPLCRIDKLKFINMFFFVSYKKKLPELITVGRNKFINKDVEDKSNSLLENQLNKCNKLIDVLREENIQQKSEVYFSYYK